MKPINKAIEAAVDAISLDTVFDLSKKECFDIAKVAVDAAYAAQFPTSEDYAGLVEELRKVEPDLPGERTRWYRNPNGPDAADALEAVLAERAAWKGRQEATAAILKRVETERDALLARLSPVEDEALVETMAEYCYPEIGHATPEKWKHSCRRVARNAIAAIRPHIEAAERERCAKVAEIYIRHDVAYCHSDSVRSAGYVTACRAIAAAIRSGK